MVGTETLSGFADTVAPQGRPLDTYGKCPSIWWFTTNLFKEKL
jgi:hypothetical protein